MNRGSRGIFISRWMLAACAMLVASVLAYLAFAPATWTIQRLESPDGRRTAVLSRTQFTSPCFVIKVKDGIAWRTVFVSPPITNSFREDISERLAWSSNSSSLFFRLQDRVVWRHDF
jgi:hypothetical protein